jgi:hypothetical protein
MQIIAPTHTFFPTNWMGKEGIISCGPKNQPSHAISNVGDGVNSCELISR